MAKVWIYFHSSYLWIFCPKENIFAKWKFCISKWSSETKLFEEKENKCTLQYGINPSPPAIVLSPKCYSTVLNKSVLSIQYRTFWFVFACSEVNLELCLVFQVCNTFEHISRICTFQKCSSATLWRHVLKPSTTHGASIIIPIKGWQTLFHNKHLSFYCQTQFGEVLI